MGNGGGNGGGLSGTSGQPPTGETAGQIGSNVGNFAGAGSPVGPADQPFMAQYGQEIPSFSEGQHGVAGVLGGETPNFGANVAATPAESAIAAADALIGPPAGAPEGEAVPSGMASVMGDLGANDFGMPEGFGMPAGAPPAPPASGQGELGFEGDIFGSPPASTTTSGLPVGAAPATGEGELGFEGDTVGAYGDTGQGLSDVGDVTAGTLMGSLLPSLDTLPATIVGALLGQILGIPFLGSGLNAMVGSARGAGQGPGDVGEAMAGGTGPGGLGGPGSGGMTDPGIYESGTPAPPPPAPTIRNVPPPKRKFKKKSPTRQARNLVAQRGTKGEGAIAPNLNWYLNRSAPGANALDLTQLPPNMLEAALASTARKKNRFQAG